MSFLLSLLCICSSSAYCAVECNMVHCSSAPADRLPSYITTKRATLRFQVDVTLEGYHSGLFSISPSVLLSFNLSRYGTNSSGLLSVQWFSAGLLFTVQLTSTSGNTAVRERHRGPHGGICAKVMGAPNLNTVITSSMNMPSQ